MELARGSFQDENSVPSCKKYHSLAHASKNLYINPSNAEATSIQSTGFLLENHLNPVELIFMEKLSLSYSQMSTHMLGFQSYFRLFASFFYGQISYWQ